MANGAEVTFVGNVTKAPELRFGQNGKPWCTFSIAVNEFGRDKSGEKTEQTTYFDCKIFGDMAENFAASIEKGARIVVIGRLRSEKWTGQDGQERRSMTVYVDEVAGSLRWAQAQFTRTAGQGQSARPMASAAASNGGSDFDEGENPFV
jgi:single-strand DNA-binding protein